MAIKVESPTVRSYRELLGVNAGATAEELRKSYHRLALLYHPDRNPGASAEFQRVKDAYEALSDPSRIRLRNQSHQHERLFNNVVDGLNFSFGSFFGYREGRDSSILDSAAHDDIELVYAGKFSLGDEERLRAGMSGSHLARLPWVILNNQGIIQFLDGDVQGALRCYAELNERIPNNIIFMYRLGLCHVLRGFQNPKRNLLGFKQPDRREIDKGILLFRKCIKLGESRSIGKQRCLLIRKFLADTLERIGHKRRALRVWRDIMKLQPQPTRRKLGTRETLLIKGR